MHEFSLRTSARAPGNVSMEEWRDSVIFDRMQKDDREYRRLQAALQYMEAQSLLRKQAVERTAAADAEYEGPKPNSREARLLETMTKSNALLSPADGLEDCGTSFGAPDVGYESLMDEVFATLNRKAVP